MSDKPLLNVDNLACERDDRLLFEGLSFNAAAGQLWQVSGPNGAGKTTLMRMLAGLFTHHEGSIRWQLDGDPREQLLYIGHRPGLREELTPLENLHWLNALHGLRDADPWAALSRVGLTGFEDVPLARLSAGQQRRAALARLWLDGKAVWILDEPFTAVDAGGMALIEARLAEKAAAGGLVFYSSHHRLGRDVHRIELGPGEDA